MNSIIDNKIKINMLLLAHVCYVVRKEVTITMYFNTFIKHILDKTNAAFVEELRRSGEYRLLTSSASSSTILFFL